jgi:hypothetical protein
LQFIDYFFYLNNIVFIYKKNWDWPGSPITQALGQVDHLAGFKNIVYGTCCDAILFVWCSIINFICPCTCGMSQYHPFLWFLSFHSSPQNNGIVDLTSLYFSINTLGLIFEKSLNWALTSQSLFVEKMGIDLTNIITKNKSI